MALVVCTVQVPYRRLLHNSCAELPQGGIVRWLTIPFIMITYDRSSFMSMHLFDCFYSCACHVAMPIALCTDTCRQDIVCLRSLNSFLALYGRSGAHAAVLTKLQAVVNLRNRRRVLGHYIQCCMLV